MIRVAASPTAAPASGEEVIRLDEVAMRFGDVVALRSAGLAVMSGTILGIIGPSGAGKTTLIRILTGGLKPTAGRARVLGEDPRRFRRQTRQEIGYMPQSFTLYPDLTAKENVDFVASVFGLLWFHRWRRVREVLQTVDLWDARNRRAGKLSGGMQRRLELACALVHEPRLLFLDEPTAGIDPLLRARVWDELHRLKDAGRTLLVTTQYVNEAEECDTVALIAEGSLIALATPEELRRQATGGDVIEVETSAPFDPIAVAGLPDVRGVERVGPTVFRAIVGDAASALPDVLEAIRVAGGDVTASREYRVSFDEVFATLVDRYRNGGEKAIETTAAGAEPDEDPVRDPAAGVPTAQAPTDGRPPDDATADARTRRDGPDGDTERDEAMAGTARSKDHR